MPGEKGTEEGCELLQRTEWRNLCASILRISQGHQTNPGSLLAREHGGSPGYAHGGSPSSCPQDGRLGRGVGWALCREGSSSLIQVCKSRLREHALGKVSFLNGPFSEPY